MVTGETKTQTGKGHKDTDIGRASSRETGQKPQARPGQGAVAKTETEKRSDDVTGIGGKNRGCDKLEQQSHQQARLDLLRTQDTPS